MALPCERKALLECVRAALRGGPVELADLSSVDWPRVCGLARQHQVTGVLYEALKNCAGKEWLPADVPARLRFPCHLTGIRNELIQRRLAEILQRAADRGLEVMLLKGAVLAYTVYARPEYRAMADVDLLVREQDFPTLREILGSFGYRASLPRLRARDLPRYAHCFEQIRFRGGGEPPLEVHFRLLNLGLPSAVEPAWDDSVTCDFAGAPARRPAPEWFLLHLCLHAQQHAFAALRLFLDIALWCRARRIDAKRFVRLAHRYHMGTPAFYALTYADQLLGLPDSESIRASLRPSAWKRRVFEHLWHDRDVRGLRANGVASEAELPRAFLLGDAPLWQKTLFLWHVCLPPRAWLARAGGRGRTGRWTHLQRILRAARHALPGNSAAAG